MRRDIPLFLGLIAAPVLVLAHNQPVLPEEPIENDMWADTNQVSNELQAPPFDPEANDTLPPAPEIQRPDLQDPRF